MERVFSDKNILSLIFCHLPDADVKSLSLLNETFYQASRLGGSLRWIITDTNRLNVLSKTFFALQIRAVKVSDLSILTCLYYLGARVRDILYLVSDKSLDITANQFIHFDAIEKLSLHLIQRRARFEVVDLPKNLKWLKISHEEKSRPNGERVVISTKLPTSLKTLRIKYVCIENVILPDGIEEFIYMDADSLRYRPVIPNGIEYLQIAGNYVDAGWSVFKVGELYPNLSTLFFELENMPLDRIVSLDTKYFPSLKQIEVTHLKLKNINLNVKSVDHLANGCRVCFRQNEKERSNKKLKTF